MTEWRDIEIAPRDKLILLLKVFPDVETPCIVVGEVVTFKGKVHHLWRGAYDGVVKVYKEEVQPDWDEKFTHWKDL